MQLDEDITRESEPNALHDSRTANELRDQLSAILGHDLRNPLQAIVVTSELIAKKSAEPDVAALARRIKANSKRMSSLIDNALDFIRGRLGGSIDIRSDDVRDINAGLRAVVQELQEGQPGRQIIADFAVTRTVRCDIGRIRQLAYNLVGNALAHGAADSAVKVTAMAAENDFIFEVWNGGRPIPPERLEKVFEPYWRHSASSSRQGLGLGLFICAQIVRAHGGKITATSTQESGTRFTVRLPLHLLS
jgi:signal transduction histidine kinase